MPTIGDAVAIREFGVEEAKQKIKASARQEAAQLPRMVGRILSSASKEVANSTRGTMSRAMEGGNHIQEKVPALKRFVDKRVEEGKAEVQKSSSEAKERSRPSPVQEEKKVDLFA
ncbi:MAG: hypothetical protein HQL57_06935 [Magnetococcales bacterium]|nr:hypothetical protein [Magnetococcales bacterium]MBF0156904.1 hypothetical protein [Magnetococcales bacterium]